MRIAVVENMAATPLGLVGQALDEAGARVELIRPYREAVLPDPALADGLIVLGGEQNACDDAGHPYLPGLAQAMRAFDAAGKPVLGICLGSQLLARAWAGENRIGGHREFGWVEIRLTEAGRQDPVLSAAGATFPAFQWHDDSFGLPPGAVHLATSAAVAPQAFRVGRASWGTQFHFEVSRAVVAHWAETLPQAMDGMAPGWRAARDRHAARDGAAGDAAGLALARAWIAQVAGR